MTKPTSTKFPRKMLFVHPGNNGKGTVVDAKGHIVKTRFVNLIFSGRTGLIIGHQSKTNQTFYYSDYKTVDKVLISIGFNINKIKIKD